MDLRRIKKLPEEEVLRRVTRHPRRKGARRLWFLYEFLNGKRLDLPDLQGCEPFPILNPRRYYTAAPIHQPRYGILNNLLGDARFCPIARPTRNWKPLPSQPFKPELPPRSVTGADAIFDEMRAPRGGPCVEHMGDDRRKAARGKGAASGCGIGGNSGFESPAGFATLETCHLFSDVNLSEVLELMGQLRLDDASLIELHNMMAPPEKGIRTFESYCGREKICYIGPAPEDLPELMEGWRSCAERILNSDLPPDVGAAIISYAFVWLHPFRDGNGKLHRFLLHPLLKAMGFEPSGPILAIGMTMRKHRDYFAAQMKVCQPIMKAIGPFSIDERGVMRVEGNRADLYRYIDYTPAVNFFAKALRRVVKRELQEEIAFWSEIDRLQRRLTRVL